LKYDIYQSKFLPGFLFLFFPDLKILLIKLPDQNRKIDDFISYGEVATAMEGGRVFRISGLHFIEIFNPPDLTFDFANLFSNTLYMGSTS